MASTQSDTSILCALLLSCRELVAKGKDFKQKHLQGLFLNIESILPVHKLLHDALETFEKTHLHPPAAERRGSVLGRRVSVIERASTLTGAETSSESAYCFEVLVSCSTCGRCDSHAQLHSRRP